MGWFYVTLYGWHLIVGNLLHSKDFANLEFLEKSGIPTLSQKVYPEKEPEQNLTRVPSKPGSTCGT